MRFMIIRKSAENTEAGAKASPELVEAMTSYHEGLAKAGVVQGGDGVKPSKLGTRVRRKGKKLSIVDGPFAETKELVAGFTIVETKSKEEALSIMRRWPREDGDVELELRQLYGAEDFPPPAGGEPAPPPAPPARKPGTTRYVLLLKSDARSEAGVPPDPEGMKAMDVLIGEVVASGALLGGEGLKRSALGAKLTRVGSKVQVIDGPFAESKEMIAGYTVLQCASKQEAIDFATRWLQVHVDYTDLDEGEVEIRPLYEAEDFVLT